MPAVCGECSERIPLEKEALKNHRHKMHIEIVDDPEGDAADPYLQGHAEETDQAAKKLLKALEDS